MTARTRVQKILRWLDRYTLEIYNPPASHARRRDTSGRPPLG